MIILDHVSKHYQTRDNKDFVAVEPTSLEIKQGEIFGLMGYSGAGKSTLLRLINLLERPDTGTVSVCGQELTALNATQLRHARQNIGMVFQQFNLLSNRTVAENVAFPLEIAKWPSKKSKRVLKNVWKLSTCKTVPTITRPNFPAVKNNVSALPVRWRRNLKSSSPTNPLPPSTLPLRAAF